MGNLKWLIAAALVLLLGGLNFYKYFGSDALSLNSEQGADSEPRIQPIPRLHVSPEQLSQKTNTDRNLFAFIKTEPPKPVFVPKPTVAEVEITGPDPSEVAQEAARVHMLNVHIKGILSSKDDLSTIVNAPFYNGVARVGSNLGNGIVVEAISTDRVTIRHVEQELQRNILVE